MTWYQDLKREYNLPLIGCVVYLAFVGGIASLSIGDVPKQTPHTWRGVAQTLIFFFTAQVLGYRAGQESVRSRNILPPIFRR